MNKIFKYFTNLGIASWRLPRAIVGQYHYHPNDGYVKNVLVTLDLLGNTLAAGDPDETISSRSGKAEGYERIQGRYGFGCRFCSFLAIFQENHCVKAINRWAGRNAVVPDEPSQ